MPFAKQLLLTCLLLPVAAILPAQDIEPRPADPAPLAHESLMLDIEQAGERYVAVGARGHVVWSRDGREWQQAEFVPVSATLTRVAFAGGRLWAVGHDSAIIHSRDLGETWTRQHFEPEWEKPLLDVHFFDANEGIAIGAYGLFMRTDNAGETWEATDIAEIVTSEAIDWEEIAEQEEEFADTEAEEDDSNGWDEDLYDAEEDFDRGCYEFVECHLNALVVADNGDLMIAAEQGYGYRSRDRGRTWESFRFPYPGSMFGLLPVFDGIIAFGLRGNVQFTDSFGDQWEVLDTGIVSTLMGGTLDPDGRPVMVGSGSAVLTYDPDTGEIHAREDRLGSDYAAVLFAEDGTMILAGDDGLQYE